MEAIFNNSLTEWDIILVNSSAGKDSQAMLDFVVKMAEAQGVKDRVVVVHADLGRVEWEGTRELAETQARHYGVRFEVVSRNEDLLTQIEKRGMWPSSTARYCTSDHKRDQIKKVMTKLTAELSSLGRPVKILNCMGLRAEESPARAKKSAFVLNKASNGKRIVWDWLPILDWTLAQVWNRINQSGVPHHRAYDLGMPRLSCVFCVFAPKSALMIAGKYNPQLLDAFVQVERKIGHTFTSKMKIESIQTALAAGEPVGLVQIDGNWNM